MRKTLTKTARPTNQLTNRLMNQLMNPALLAVLLAVTFLVSGGCGNGHPRCYPVSGTVWVDGKPLSGELDGTVRFVSTDTESTYGRPATGKIDENGRFSLTSYEDGDGCPRGTYRVTLIILQSRGNKMFYVVPPRYESAAQTDIQVEVGGKTENLKLEAKWLPDDKPFRAPIKGTDGAS